MANFFDIKQPKLVKVKPYFSHLPFLTQPSNPSQSHRSASISSSSISSSYSHNNNNQNINKNRNKSSNNHQINHKKLNDFDMYTTNNLLHDDNSQKSRKLSLVSKLIILHMENQRNMATTQKQYVQNLRINIEKADYVDKQMRNRLKILNNTLGIRQKPEQQNELKLFAKYNSKISNK